MVEFTNMDSRQTFLDIPSGGAPRRLPRRLNITGGEARVNPNTAIEDEDSMPNPCQGSIGSDSHAQERADLNLRHTALIGTWNTRGMDNAKMQIITKQMEELDVMILGVSEHWMLGQGRFSIGNDHTMVYSGKEDGSRRQGVGFILNRKATKALMGYNPISPRIITIRMKGHPLNLSIIQVYAPTADSSEEESELFYEQLQETIDNIPPRDMLMVTGDLNAKVGKMQQKNLHVGAHGLGTQNARGTTLMEFCAGNDLVITNTCFAHHPRRMYTWRSPGDRTRNQIDYILIKRRWRTSVQDTKTRPSADCGSDHQLLLTKLKIKLKINTKKNPPIRYDVQSIPDSFTLSIRNRFATLLQYAEEDHTPEELWQEMCSNMKAAAKEHIPAKKRIKRPWLSTDTINIADQRKKQKLQVIMTGGRN